MNTKNKNQFVGTGPTKNRREAQPKNELLIEKHNIRTIMQVLHGCRKNCQECREEELEWEEENHG